MTRLGLKSLIQTYRKKTRSHANNDIYYIGYITMKDLDYVNIHSVNLLYFVIDEVDGYVEKSNGNKYLTLVSTDKIHRTLEQN